MPRGAKAPSTLTPASSTWMPTALTPFPLSQRRSVCRRHRGSPTRFRNVPPYNRWLADYCRPYPDRLFGVAMPPMQSLDLAIDEMRYARQQLGMRGGFLRPNPYKDRMLHDPPTSRSGRWPRSS